MNYNKIFKGGKLTLVTILEVVFIVIVEHAILCCSNGSFPQKLMIKQNKQCKELIFQTKFLLVFH